MGYFPSVSAAWNITEEKFMKNQTIFDQLKLRAGFGIVGNQNIDDFAYLSLYNVSYTGTSDTGYTNSLFPMGDVVLQILVGRNKTMEFRSRYGFLTE